MQLYNEKKLSTIPCSILQAGIHNSLCTILLLHLRFEIHPCCIFRCEFDAVDEDRPDLTDLISIRKMDLVSENPAILRHRLYADSRWRPLLTCHYSTPSWMTISCALRESSIARDDFSLHRSTICGVNSSFTYSRIVMISSYLLYSSHLVRLNQTAFASDLVAQ